MCRRKQKIVSLAVLYSIEHPDTTQAQWLVAEASITNCVINNADVVWCFDLGV